jgi:hypothetical protein
MWHYTIAAILGIIVVLWIRRSGVLSRFFDSRTAYNQKIMEELNKTKLIDKIPQCVMTADVDKNLKCLRAQQMSYYNTEYDIVKVLQAFDNKGYQELQMFTIMVYDFFRSYASMFHRSEEDVLTSIMTSKQINRGGNLGKNLERLRELMTPVTDFSPFKMNDKRPNHREFTQAILANHKQWCAYIWFMIVGLVKKKDKILSFMRKNGINFDNIALRAEMIKRYMSEDVNYIIDKICDINNIEEKGIPLDACSKGPKGPGDLKCDIFCGNQESLCILSLRTFSFYKTGGKALQPSLEFTYGEGYGKGSNYKPKPFPRLFVKELIPLPSSRELEFWRESGWRESDLQVPWPNAMNVILTNPANPMADLSLNREDLTVAGTSGHMEILLSLAILFDRYKDPQKLKDLIRGAMVSIAPHHHSIREIATAAYPPPYNINFNFQDGPYQIVNNLL